MKSSIKGLFVILAIVMSFALVQGVWARDIEIAIGIVEESVDETTRSIPLELDTSINGEDNITIDGMGPSWYWDLMSIKYPEAGDYLEIEVFYCDILGKYVGVRVCYIDDYIGCNVVTCCIDLRDEDLKPLWNPKANKTDPSETAAEATGDGVPNDYDHNYDYNWKDEEEPAPHGKKDF
jgi:hypothetical protein